MNFEITIDDVKHFLASEGIFNNVKSQGVDKFSINSPFADDKKSRLSFSYIKHDKKIPDGVYFNDFKARGVIDDDLYKGSFYKFVKLLKEYKTIEEAQFYYLSNYFVGNMSEALRPPKPKIEEPERKKIWKISLPENSAPLNKSKHPTYWQYLRDRGVEDSIIEKHRLYVNLTSKRIIFPIYEGDDLVFYIGRSIIKYIPKEFRWKKVSASEMQPIWNLNNVDSPDCWIFESPLDGIHFHNGVATMTAFINDAMVDKIVSKGFNKIIVCMQNPYNDNTANVQRMKVAEKFAAKHQNVFLYDWRGIEEKDFGEMKMAKKPIDLERIIRYDFQAKVAHKLGVI